MKNYLMKNIIVNGNFAKDLAHWEVFGEAQIMKSIPGLEVPAVLLPSLSGLQQRFTTVSKGNYRFSYRARRWAGVPGAIYTLITLMDDGAWPRVEAVRDDWALFTFDLPPNVRPIDIRLVSYAGDELVTDVQIVETTATGQKEQRN